MIRHLLRKDWRLLWPFAVLAVASQLVLAAMTVKLGLFQEPAELRLFARLFTNVVLIAFGLLIAVLVHQNALFEVAFGERGVLLAQQPSALTQTLERPRRGSHR